MERTANRQIPNSPPCIVLSIFQKTVRRNCPELRWVLNVHMEKLCQIPPRTACNVFVWVWCPPTTWITTTNMRREALPPPMSPAAKGYDEGRRRLEAPTHIFHLHLPTESTQAGEEKRAQRGRLRKKGEKEKTGERRGALPWEVIPAVTTGFSFLGFTYFRGGVGRREGGMQSQIKGNSRFSQSSDFYICACSFLSFHIKFLRQYKKMAQKYYGESFSPHDPTAAAHD